MTVKIYRHPVWSSLDELNVKESPKEKDRLKSLLAYAVAGSALERPIGACYETIAAAFNEQDGYGRLAITTAACTCRTIFYINYITESECTAVVKRSPLAATSRRISRRILPSMVFEAVDILWLFGQWNMEYVHYLYCHVGCIAISDHPQLLFFRRRTLLGRAANVMAHWAGLYVGLILLVWFYILTCLVHLNQLRRQTFAEIRSSVGSKVYTVLTYVFSEPKKTAAISRATHLSKHPRSVKHSPKARLVRSMPHPTDGIPQKVYAMTRTVGAETSLGGRRDSMLEGMSKCELGRTHRKFEVVDVSSPCTSDRCRDKSRILLEKHPESLKCESPRADSSSSEKSALVARRDEKPPEYYKAAMIKELESRIKAFSGEVLDLSRVDRAPRTLPIVNIDRQTLSLFKSKLETVLQQQLRERNCR